MADCELPSERNETTCGSERHETKCGVPRHEGTEHTYLIARVESRGRMAGAERDGVFVRGRRQGMVAKYGEPYW